MKVTSIYLLKPFIYYTPQKIKKNKAKKLTSPLKDRINLTEHYHSTIQNSSGLAILTQK